MVTAVVPFIGRVKTALRQHQGDLLAALLQVSGHVPLGGSVLAQPPILRDHWNRAHAVASAMATGTMEEIEERCDDELAEPWAELVVAHLQTMHAIQRRKFAEAYAHQAQLAAILTRAIVNEDRWVLPVLYAVISDVRLLAGLADKELQFQQGKKADRIEDAAHVLNKAFHACITDRSPLNMSKKLGALNVVNHLFKVYMRLQQLRLCTNLIKSVKMAGFPDMDKFPASHTVTFRFYSGLLAFYEEDYLKASEDMKAVLKRCHKDSRHNKRLILVYLIPMRMLEGTAVRDDRLRRYNLTVYSPLVQAFRRGHIGRFNQAIDQLEPVLQRRGVYLVWERLRIAVYRNLFKRSHAMLNTNKIPLMALLRALHLAGEPTATLDDLECLLAVLIDKGYIKGYIAHAKSFLVVSHTEPFPIGRA